MNIEERIKSCSKELLKFKKEFSRKSNEKGIFMNSIPSLSEILSYHEKGTNFRFKDYQEGEQWYNYFIPIRLYNGLHGIRVDGKVVSEDLKTIWPSFYKKNIALSMYSYLRNGDTSTSNYNYLMIKTKFDNSKPYSYLGGPLNLGYSTSYILPSIRHGSRYYSNQWDTYDWESFPFIMCAMPINVDIQQFGSYGNIDSYFVYYGGMIQYFVGQ